MTVYPEGGHGHYFTGEVFFATYTTPYPSKTVIMRVLFIGGTGIISSACTRLAIARGIDLTLLNRGQRAEVPGTKQIVADINDPVPASVALKDQKWDVVVDFISFTPEDLKKRIDLFSGHTGQFIFISSASAYQRPVTDYLITESTPLANPFWEYSRNKIACEELLITALREDGFPATIIRPSFTYSEWIVPLAINSWPMPYTAIDRMRKGQPVVIPGDGTSLWTLTNNADFAKGLVGLLGHHASVGHAFHITSDEVLNWNQIYEATAEAAGVDSLNVFHIASDFIAACLPDEIGGLHGYKSTSVVMDNAKIKRFVPDFVATTRYSEGIKNSIAWFDADKSRQKVDNEWNRTWDKLIGGYQSGLDTARIAFGQ
jgi:nucleoside-diphosphate-sugar epimerase